jgi:hypothetical protein
MEGTDFEVKVLGLTVLALGFGGAFLTAVLLERLRTRYATAALIGFATALLYNSVPTRPISGSMAEDLALSPLIGCAVAAVGTYFYHEGLWFIEGPKLRIWLRAILFPRNWKDVTVPPVEPKALVARWFVAIAAGTGSVVGALMQAGDFWEAAARAIAPTHIIFTVLLTVVSIALIGPLEEYVFGLQLRPRHDGDAHEHEAASPRGLIEDIWENFSWRAAGRLGLVFLFSFQPTILHSCLDETISHGDAAATFTIVSAAIGPIFTTYYWSAALQRGVPSISARAGASTTVFSAFLWWPAMSTSVVFYLSNQLGRNAAPEAFILFITGLFGGWALAFVWGFVLDGLQAFIGGAILDGSRRRHDFASWQAVATLTAALAITKLIEVFVLTLFGTMMTGIHLPAADWLGFLLTPLSTVGWMAGLVVSGFPKILHGARANAPETNVRHPDAVTGTEGG